jgi:serine/threonine protein kinase
MMIFPSLHLLQKKKDTLLYKASDDSKSYILKCADGTNPLVRQAFFDEYTTLHRLSHPSIPVYYALLEDYPLPEQPGRYLVLCMEDRSLPTEKDSVPYSIRELMEILDQTGDTLSYLLKNGILYTDLNPSNLIIDRSEGRPKVTLVDYTYCYYYLTNPHPKDPLRFSYDLSSGLHGQQLLIQEMSLLLQELLEQNQPSQIPSSVYRLLQTGKTPPEGLCLEDFSAMIAEILV